MPSKVECNVCLESTTIKKTIECLHCQYKSCVQCTERYLLSLEEPAKCMNCSATWNDDFMVSMFSKQYMNGAYKKHITSVLMKKESQKLPQTQLLVERELKKRKAEAEIKEIQKHKKKQMQILDERIRSLQRQITTGNYINEEQANENAMSGRKCPTEACKGFLNCCESSICLSCSICEEVYCKDCNVSWSEGHQCDESLKESVQFIINNTTPCPSCGIQIQKSEGCDQMWCTECHTAFSYKTGKIENGYIHNPLYLQWRRQAGINAREPNDYPCGGLPDSQVVLRNVLNHIEQIDLPTSMYISAQICNRYYNTSSKPIDKAYMLFGTLHNLSLYNYRVNDTINHNEIRVKWMLGEISDSKFESMITSREKKCKFNKDIGYRINAMLFGIVEIFQRMATEKMTTLMFKNYIVELYNLKTIYNTSLLELGKKYGQSYGLVPFVTNEWKVFFTKTKVRYDIYDYIDISGPIYTSSNIDRKIYNQINVDRTNDVYNLVNNSF